MENLLLFAVVVSWWCFLIYLNRKGKFKLMSLLAIIRMCLTPLGIGFVLIYALPSHDVAVYGNPTPQIPFSVAVAMLIAGTCSFIFSKNEDTLPDKTNLVLRWFLFIPGILLQIVGVYLAMITYIAPHILGFKKAMPHIGVYIFLTIVIVSCLLLYLSAKMNSKNNPNFFRLLVFWSIYLLFDLVGVLSLQLIYTPQLISPPGMYPYLSGFICLGFLPYCIVLALLPKDYINQK